MQSLIEQKYKEKQKQINYWARKYARGDQSKIEELTDGLSLKVIEVVNRYKENKNLDSIITTCIKNYIYNFVKQNARRGEVKDIEENINIFRDNSAHEDIKFNLYLRSIKSKLSSKEYEVLLALLGCHTEFNQWLKSIGKKYKSFYPDKRVFFEVVKQKDIITYFKLRNFKNYTKIYLRLKQVVLAELEIKIEKEENKVCLP